MTNFTRGVHAGFIVWALFPCTLTAGDYHSLAQGLNWGGSYRSRYEVKNDYQFGTNGPGDDETYLLSQFRLHLRWAPSETFLFYIEGQDSRIQGEEWINADARPGTFADEIDLHQGYLELRLNRERLPVQFRAGRQKLKFGAERLVGAFEWANTARVFDAVRLTIGKPEFRTLDAFMSHVTPVDPKGWNDWRGTGNRLWDSYLHGLYYTDHTVIRNGVWENYVLMRNESHTDSYIITFGLRFTKTLENWDVDGELATQTGELEDRTPQSWALHVGAGYTLASLKTRIGAAYNFGSGDDDPASDTQSTFDNLYPTNHAHYGYMDLFSWKNMHNLEWTVAKSFVKNVSVRAALHSFWIANTNDFWYNAGGAATNAAWFTGPDDGPTDTSEWDSHAGNEVDLTVSYPVCPNFTFAGGYSHFWSGGYVRDGNAATEGIDFGYLQVSVAF